MATPIPAEVVPGYFQRHFIKYKIVRPGGVPELWEVRIFEYGYSGDPTEVHAGPGFTWAFKGDVWERFGRTALEFDVAVDSVLQLEHLITDDDRQFHVELWGNGKLKWLGWLASNVYAEQLLKPTHFVKFAAVDGFGFWRHIDAPAMSPPDTLAEILQRAMVELYGDKIPLLVKSSTRIRPGVVDLSLADLEISVEGLRYNYSQRYDKSTLNFYTLLDRILESCNLQLSVAWDADGKLCWVLRDVIQSTDGTAWRQPPAGVGGWEPVPERNFAHSVGTDTAVNSSPVLRVETGNPGIRVIEHYVPASWADVEVFNGDDIAALSTTGGAILESAGFRRRSEYLNLEVTPARVKGAAWGTVAGPFFTRGGRPGERWRLVVGAKLYLALTEATTAAYESFDVEGDFIVRANFGGGMVLTERGNFVPSNSGFARIRLVDGVRAVEFTWPAFGVPPRLEIHTPDRLVGVDANGARTVLTADDGYFVCEIDFILLERIVDEQYKASTYEAYSTVDKRDEIIEFNNYLIDEATALNFYAPAGFVKVPLSPGFEPLGQAITRARAAWLNTDNHLVEVDYIHNTPVPPSPIHAFALDYSPAVERLMAPIEITVEAGGAGRLRLIETKTRPATIITTPFPPPWPPVVGPTEPADGGGRENPFVGGFDTFNERANIRPPGAGGGVVRGGKIPAAVMRTAGRDADIEAAFDVHAFAHTPAWRFSDARAVEGTYTYNAEEAQYVRLAAEVAVDIAFKRTDTYREGIIIVETAKGVTVTFSGDVLNAPAGGLTVPAGGFGVVMITALPRCGWLVTHTSAYTDRCLPAGGGEGGK